MGDANMVSFVVSEGRGHTLFADTRVAHQYDPVRFCARAN